MSVGGVEGKIREKIIEADLVDCMVALPSQLFYNTGIPACLWFLSRDKTNGNLRDRKGEILFIDARKLGLMVDRTHRELADEDISRITATYHFWRGEGGIMRIFKVFVSQSYLMKSGNMTIYLHQGDILVKKN